MYGGVLLVAALGGMPAVAGTCKPVVLPVTFERRTPAVPVTLNGQAFSIAIDTGAQVTFVTPETATQLQLPADQRYYYSRIRGASGAYTTVNAIVHSLKFAGVEYKKKRVNVVQLNPEHPAGPSLKGLIGADILTDFAFEYDTVGRSFTVFPADSCPFTRPSWTGRYTRIPFAITERNGIAIPVIVNGHQLTGIFDTGATVTTMTSEAARRIGLTREALDKDPHYPQTGASGNPRIAALHRFDSMVLAGETFRKPAISVANFSISEGDMLIGEDFMQGHRFRISYANQALYMQRVAVKTKQ